ncbi:MAG: branched-chain amino acid ABC transporter permease [Bacillota bacterium]
MHLGLQIGQQLANGLALGSIYALLALGYTMVYGIIKLINFAHGDLLMLGAFGGYFVLRRWGVSLATVTLAFVTSMGCCAALGVVLERLCYRPLRQASRINALITAIGVSLFLENGARVTPGIGPNFREFPPLAPAPVDFGGISLSQGQLMVLGVSVWLMAVLNYIVNFTKIGKAMRAVAFDRGAAALMGINIDRTIAVTFAIGSALAAAAGILYAGVYPQIEPYMGVTPGLKAFVAAVLGGIGSVPGAMAGGLLLGTAETLTKGLISSQLADAIAFGILILVLLLKPTGILGKSSDEKV